MHLDPDTVDARDSHGQTALMRAAHAGDRQAVEHLVRAGANLDITAKYGLSALMLAIVAGHEEIAQILVAAGADLSLRGSGAPGFAGKKASELAAERGMNLLRRGANSALEHAIYHGPLPAIRGLLEIGANPNDPDAAGFPSLIAALSCANPRPGLPGRTDTVDIITLLLEFGADPNQRGINDYTPLHMAVAERHLPAIGALLKAGADPTLRTRIDDYETPREMAEMAGLTEIAKLLAAAE